MEDSDSDSRSIDTDDRGRRTNRRGTARNEGVGLDEGTSHSGQAKKSINRLRKFVLDGIPQLLDTYEYRPLNEEQGEEIRVLVVEPGKKEDPISVKLVPSALGDSNPSRTTAHKFDALSYFWGQGDPIDTIEVSSYKNLDEPMGALTTHELAISAMKNYKEGAKDGKLTVRRNLKSALVHFRHEKKRRILWIDALCINQNNPDERSKQVAKMHRLYINAQIVSVWLGDGTTENPVPKPCFKFLKAILNLQNLEDTLKSLEDEPDQVESARDVIRLMRNKWFSRRWVVQELALARKARVVYGKEKMGWSDFSDAIAIFIQYKDRIIPPVQSLLKSTVASTEEVDAAKSIEDLGANILVDFTNSFFRRDRDGNIQQRMMSLEILVSSLLPFEATDPRDTIYAVLSLANDTYQDNQILDKRLIPDYKCKLLLDVYTNFIEYCAEKSRSLDILLRHWATSDGVDPKMAHKELLDKNYKRPLKGDLPSWIPKIKDSSHGTPRQRAKGRSFGDSFVWNSFETSHKNYCATLDIPPVFHFGKKGTPEVCDGRLFVQGLQVGKVDSLSDRATHGIIFANAPESAGFDREEFEDTGHWSPGIKRVPEEFWRTLVADRGPYGRNTPSWYSRACMEALNNRTPSGDIEPDRVAELLLAPRVCKLFLKRVKHVLMGRSFARIELKGPGPKLDGTKTYGLLPGKARDRDIVCVFFGCSVPVVLRPNESEGCVFYEMIGECFIYGIMQGQAVSGMQKLEPSLQQGSEFQLR
ncbi:hypothetical protein HYFRA_00000652 [Hymenoscyphus fraxineus]|uniref:Heterokaryon incompatibility domain-containing protein n=1 Tax=Hymenoscyphus fraxineus TaxID=746836 RepID=A0A9N9PY39_9HELO|nr:hypothetical protein HYFRA_00000652 [Hymenoscyphus fraxineus]